VRKRGKGRTAGELGPERRRKPSAREAAEQAAAGPRRVAGPLEEAARLRAAAVQAEQAGRAGQPGQAARGYGALVAEAVAVLPHRDPIVLLLRHQLAHWVGESGEPEAAVEMFTALLADREAHQGPHHADTELARHQLAHWHGRAGRAAEAAHRYAAMYERAERAGRTETALDLLCNVGHWQQEGGDTASALRTFTRMLDAAEQRLGPGHQTAAIARQRYAVLAGDLPFGHDRGHDSLRDLRTAAREVERAGDLLRAARMHGRIAEQAEYLYGVGSSQPSTPGSRRRGPP
jgi:eukaryotic-like serine/threonine-protein kinase